MITSVKELHDKRVELAKTIKEMADRQDSWDSEDNANWETLNADYDQVVAQLEERQRQDDIDARRQQLIEDSERLQRSPATRRQPGQFTVPSVEVTDEERALSLQAWLCYQNKLEVSERMESAANRCGVDYRDSVFAANLFVRSPSSGFELFSVQNGQTSWTDWNARRDTLVRMNTTTPGEGAEFVPEMFSYEYEKALMAYGGFRRVSRIYPTSGGNTLKWPTVTDLANKAVIVGEEASIGSHTPPTTGEIEFGAYKYSSLPVIVSQELLEDSAFNMSALLGELLGERVGRGQAEHFAVGNGTSQPQGVTVGATTGHTAASATAIVSDDLIDLQGSLDPAYKSLSSVGWAFNNTTLTAIRKLKDGNDQYLWQPGLQAGVPDILLGNRYVVIQEMPDIAASGKPIAYGAFEKFIIRDVAAYRFYRLEELYRANDQTGFVALHRVDSKVINPEAIKLLEMAAA